MNTQEFNKKRTEEWLKRFNADESRVFLIVGVKQDGALTFLVDETQSYEKIAQKLELLARSVRERYKSTS